MNDQSSENNDGASAPTGPLTSTSTKPPPATATTIATTVTTGDSCSQELLYGDVPPAAVDAVGMTVTAVNNHGNIRPGLAASSSVFQPVSSSADPSNFSSSSESEHLPSAAATVTSFTNDPSFSSSAMALDNGNASANAVDNDNNNQSPAVPSSSSQWKTPSHSCISRPSSLSSKSRGSQASSTPKPHAYFASSEEESEAELEENSHSSRDNNNQASSHANYGHHPLLAARGPGGITGKSNLRGSKKLAEIASQVSGSSHHSSLHSSRVRMTIPQNHHDTATIPNHKESIGSGKPASIYKTTSSNHSTMPPPPQMVTVAVGESNLGDMGQPDGNILPSPNSSSLTPPASSSPLRSSRAPASSATTAPSASLHHVNLPPYTSQPPKRIRKKTSSSNRHQHLPRGLPVFKDPRACMWTSTHDANAPSEDRYSSLVNVLLRPPKTPRGDGKKNADNNSNGNGNGHGNGNNKTGESQSCDGSSETEQASGKPSSTPHSKNATPSGDATENKAPDSTDDDEHNTSLIRLSLWSVIDGHGGGCVATYAAEVLLPHIAASVARALKSEIVDRGVCNVNGQLRDANALDLDGLIRSSDRSRHVGKSQTRQREAGIDVVNPNSIHYRSPYEDSESEGDVGIDHVSRGTQSTNPLHHSHHHRHLNSDGGMRSESESEAESEAGPVSVASSLLPGNPITHLESVSSVKTSVKTAVSPVMQHAPVGTHSPAEVASITRAITDSFLAVDEGWINSIDPVTTHQTSCVSNGRWNAGACALVVFIVQRLDWCRSSRVDHETHHGEGRRGARGMEDTTHNNDAARRRKADYATKSKSVSSLSTLSSTSSITTEANLAKSMQVGEESEITEDDDDVSDIFGPRTRRRRKNHRHSDGHRHDRDEIDDDLDPHHREGVFIATPAGCKCHYYRPHDAMLYTAHVGDCRAVMLGSAPPRTIKVPPEGAKDSLSGGRSLSLDVGVEDMCSEYDESSSESIADEISSSAHDSDSSGDDMMEDCDFLGRGGGGRGRTRRGVHATAGGAAVPLGYVRRASKRQRRNERNNVINQPFVPLPPLNRHDLSSEESAVESDGDDSTSTTAQEHLPPVGSIVRTTALGVLGSASGVAPPGVFDHPLETEDEIEDEIKEIRSVRSGSPTQMDRPPSPTQLVADPIHPPPLPLSMLMRPIDLTTDHSAYNPAEVTAVLRRCNNAPKAISSASSGGIKRVAGSLAVTRALGDAYLKTPRLSFFPYKRHAPYITGRPEVNCRVLTKGADRILTLASDGVWERASGDDVLRWVRNYYNARIAGVKMEEEHHLQHAVYDSMMDRGNERHDPYVGGDAEKSSSRSRKHDRLSSSGKNEGEMLLGGNNSGDDALGNPSAAAAASSGEISSVDGTVQEKTDTLTPPMDNTTAKMPAGGNASAGEAAASEDSDAAASEMTAVTTAANETAVMSTASKAGGKRKHSSTNTAMDDSESTRTASTTGSRGGRAVGLPSSSRGHRSHHHHHGRSSSRPYSLSIPTVSEVIVRKVLNKVRKTRNISSLRMLMSLPKGRARRSKHDDITATVVDLSGFVS